MRPSYPPSAPEPRQGSASPVQRYGYVPSEAELREALARARGNLAEVGRQFGRERMQVHRWLKRYNIDIGQYR